MYSIFYGEQKTKATEIKLSDLDIEPRLPQKYDMETIESLSTNKPFYQQLNERQKKKQWRK